MIRIITHSDTAFTCRFSERKRYIRILPFWTSEITEEDEMKKQNLKLGVHLIPAVLTIALIAGFSAKPELEKIPEKLDPIEESVMDDEFVEELAAAEGDYDDGTYTGSGEGYGGPIKVEVTVEDRQITEVKILEASKEDSSFFNRAKNIVDDILRLQTWDVDVISGATYSSNGIKAAVENALTGEEVKTEKADKKASTGNSAALKKVSYTKPSGGYKDGTYTGSATGFGGNIGVSVTISGGKITGINVTSASGETASYLASAKGVISRIISSQSPNVDSVSGATYSSNGIINAVKNALNKAGNSSSNSNSSGSSSTPTPKVNNHYTDGTYTGVGEGYGGPIKVTVTVKSGQITKVNIDSAAEETAAYLNKAKAVINSIIEKQTWKVDAVSGATFSSQGIMEAVEKAMSNKQTPSNNTTPSPVKRNYADGVYTGSGTGYKGSNIRVQVTIKGGKITAIEVLEAQKEGPRYKKAADGVIDAIMIRQNWDVDSISGATFTSNGIKEAVEIALDKAEKAAQVTPTPTTTPAPSTTASPSPTPEVKEVVYSGTATVTPDEYNDFSAYKITVNITVRISDDTREIISSEVVAETNTTNKRYVKTAWQGMLPGLTASNKSDAISGATCSSIAVQEAWSQAVSKIPA